MNLDAESADIGESAKCRNIRCGLMSNCQLGVSAKSAIQGLRPHLLEGALYGVITPYKVCN